MVEFVFGTFLYQVVMIGVFAYAAKWVICSSIKCYFEEKR